ncbi:ABC transporter substrate-binding protein [Rhodococcus erythropolis]|uniref:ABC transporter substrate-binding protein n=1 Tax=Rhodococcus erythropolis TaxID=1833 RepID=UPI0024B66B54|nr:ABC transporter substrate-binding protein [Rhodococcus erythropolis]MDJ0016549.1 ABC transporter substrate-binding protein [Rhodococcus erythropolis]
MKIKTLLAVCAALTVTVTACADPDETIGHDGGSTTRSISHELGTVDIPSVPTALIALDEIAGLAALLSGITPASVYASTGDIPSRAILEDAGVDVEDVSVGTLPPLEELVAKTPDLLVGTGAASATGTTYAQLSDIAPTVVLPIEGDWRSLIRNSSLVFGAEQAGQAQIDVIEDLLDDASSVNHGTELSLLGNSFGQTTFTMPPHSPVSTLIAAAGFTRPESQLEETEGYSTVLSNELLPQNDADIIVVPTGTYYTADALTTLPIWATLTGVTVEPVGESWFGTHAFAFYVIATDLRTLASGETGVSNPQSIPSLWKTFTAAIES